MMPVLSRFGLGCLPLKTPFPGLQVCDLISGGAIMGGAAPYLDSPLLSIFRKAR
jgi:hypothetical protein